MWWFTISFKKKLIITLIFHTLTFFHGWGWKQLSWNHYTVEVPSSYGIRILNKINFQSHSSEMRKTDLRMMNWG